MTTFLDELKWRGLLKDRTAGIELDQHLDLGRDENKVRTGYCGFDPTSDSLHAGNLLPIMLLKRFQLAGHRPIVLMGGGTGLIGDPSGKDSERSLQTREQVEANIAGQRKVFERLLDFSKGDARGAKLVNNIDWLEKLSYLDVLRDVGKHFSVNAMIQKDSVRTRLESREQGISYTEFSYMLLQSYDFLHLYRAEGCTVQLAGSDQYGNIVGGIDLIRRSEGEHRAFGITAPLLTKSDGKKFGKSEKGAVWLNADKTSPYAFYQFWINVEDADVGSLLNWFTLLAKAEIYAVMEAHGASPHKREAQRLLAREMTRLVHGQDELEAAELATQALFDGDVRRLSARSLDEAFADVPSSDHDKALLDGEGVALLDLVASTPSLAQSKREARQFLETGAVSVNGDKADLGRKLRSEDLLHGKAILLRRGKKNWHVTRWR
jgi:tyrosyl-tRNA synthetase